MRTSLFSSVLVGALLAGCGSSVVNPVTGQAERSVMDEKTEIAEGQKAHQQVLQEYGVYNNPAVQAYVNALWQRLAVQSHRTQLQWHFTVLNTPEINAFALPGGHGAQRATSQQNAGLGVLAASVLGAQLESQGVTGAGKMAAIRSCKLMHWAPNTWHATALTSAT